MVENKRENYLKTEWKRYPKIPTGWLSGRLIQDGIVLTSDNEQTEINFSDSPITGVLRVGDIIAWDPSESEIIILAPAVQEPHLISENHPAVKWPEFLQTVRGFFTFRQFKEVQTPTLVQSSGSETHLEPFITGEFYLPTSPEFHLKNLLSRGLNKIYEIKTCYRKGEISQHHQPEFTMLEWYRGYSDLKSILHDTIELINEVCDQPKTEIITMAEVFKKHLGFNLQPNTSQSDLVTLAKKNNIVPHSTDTWNDLFFRIFIEKIEPIIGHTQPTIIKDFPPSMSALARLSSEGWAERFELYWRGLEIANAYDELNDPQENLKRLALWNQEKISLGKKPVPVSIELMEAMNVGLPPSGGIALGLDRLFMAMNNIEDIRKTRFFPI